jgi:hypothetical protein
MANNFEAIIKARLDTSGVENQIKNEINNRQVNLHNVTVNTANLIQQIQNALNSNTFQINVNSANVQNSIRQMGNMGQSVGRQFVQGFNRELNNIHLVNGGIGNVRNMLQGAGFDKNSINAITQDLNRMVLAIDEVQTRQLSNGNISIRLTGVDELNRGVQIIREFNRETGNIVNTSKTFTQTVGRRRQAVKEFNATLEKAQAAIRQGDIGAAISSVQKQYSQFATSGHQNLGAISTDLAELYRLQTELCRTTDSQTLVRNYERYNEVLNRVRNNLKIVSNETKMFATATEVATLQNRMETWLNNNSRAVKTYGTTISGLVTRLRELSAQGNVEKAQLQQLAAEFTQVKTAAQSAGLTGKTFGDSLKGAFLSISRYISASTLIYTAIRAVKNGISDVVALDTALVDLRKTTDATESELKQFYYTSNDVAKQLGVTTQEVISAAAEWSRLGYSIKDAETMAQVSSIFKSISPGMDMTEATDGLVSAMKAFDIEANQALDGIASKINAVGNSQAVSNKDIVEFLTRSSSAMKEANNTLEETVALGTAATEITRDAASVGKWRCRR